MVCRNCCSVLEMACEVGWVVTGEKSTSIEGQVDSILILLNKKVLLPGVLPPSRLESIYPLYIILIDANIINILQFEFPIMQIKCGLLAVIPVVIIKVMLHGLLFRVLLKFN